MTGRARTRPLTADFSLERTKSVIVGGSPAEHLARVKGTLRPPPNRSARRRTTAHSGGKAPPHCCTVIKATRARSPGCNAVATTARSNAETRRSTCYLLPRFPCSRSSSRRSKRSHPSLPDDGECRPCRRRPYRTLYRITIDQLKQSYASIGPPFLSALLPSNYPPASDDVGIREKRRQWRLLASRRPE